jgi:hypothetical protein
MDIPEKIITEKTYKTVNYFEIDDIRINKQKVIVSVKLYMKNPRETFNPLQTPTHVMDITLKQADFKSYLDNEFNDEWLKTFVATYIWSL